MADFFYLNSFISQWAQNEKPDISLANVYLYPDVCEHLTHLLKNQIEAEYRDFATGQIRHPLYPPSYFKEFAGYRGQYAPQVASLISSTYHHWISAQPEEPITVQYQHDDWCNEVRVRNAPKISHCDKELGRHPDVAMYYSLWHVCSQLTEQYPITQEGSRLMIPIGLLREDFFLIRLAADLRETEQLLGEDAELNALAHMGIIDFFDEVRATNGHMDGWYRLPIN